MVGILWWPVLLAFVPDWRSQSKFHCTFKFPVATKFHYTFMLSFSHLVSHSAPTNSKTNKEGLNPSCSGRPLALVDAPSVPSTNQCIANTGGNRHPTGIVVLCSAPHRPAIRPRWTLEIFYNAAYFTIISKSQ